MNGARAESSPSVTRARLLRTCSRIMRGIGRAIDLFENAVLAFSTALLAAVVIANIFARYFAQNIYFAEEVAEFLIIMITFVGLSYGARKARHIRMGAFMDLLPAPIEKALVYLISAGSACVMFVMSYHAWNYMVHVRQMEQMTSALRIPYWTFLVIVPLGFAAAGIQYVRAVAKNIREPDVWHSCEQRSEYEEYDESGQAA